MDIKHQALGRALVLSVCENRIDASVALEFRDALRAQIDAGQHELVLDLSSVEFIDSSGLGSIVGALKYLGKRGTLVLSGLSQPVQRLFQLTRMERVFRIYPTVAEAANDFH